MVARLGIGATSASAIIFSVLLATNFVAYVASQDRERLYYQADAENALSVNAIALTGATGANVLFAAQALLGSGNLTCSAASAAATQAIGRFSDLQRSGGLTVSVSARMAHGVPVGDNLSVLAPFSGTAVGEVNIALAVVMSGSDSGVGASFSKTEVHFVHLPVRLESLTRDCLGAFHNISQAITTTTAPNCTVVAIAPLLRSASQGPASLAESDGFSLRVDFAVIPGVSCTIGLRVSLEQAAIEGPGGYFNAGVEEAGSVSFEQAASSRQA